ncbi:MAG: hypothetical protein HYZ53_28330 [Planctomycetes bacterium]|nr:hypothetical protein [Planctomycetota bacterium]
MQNAMMKWGALGIAALGAAALLAGAMGRGIGNQPKAARSTDADTTGRTTASASTTPPLDGIEARPATAGPADTTKAARVVLAPSRLIQALDAAKTDPRPAKEITSTVAAAQLRALAARLPELADVARLGRTMGADPEMVKQLTPLLEEWAASTDANLRARAEILRVSLLGDKATTAWADALDRSTDLEVRRALLAAAPLTGEPDRDRACVERLVTAATSDLDGKARTAALQGMPARIETEALYRLGAAVAAERETPVRGELVRLLGRQRSDDPQVLQVLRRVGQDAAEDREVRREALAGVIRTANAHPELLKPAEIEAIEKTLGGLDR